MLVVVAAAHSPLAHGRGHGQATTIPRWWVEIGIGLMLAFGVTVLVMGMPTALAELAAQPRKQPSVWKRLLIIPILLMVGLIVRYILVHHLLGHTQTGHLPPRRIGPLGNLNAGGKGGHAPPLNYTHVGLVSLLVLALVVLAATVLRPRRPPLLARPEADADTVTREIDETLDDLRREPDPRRAVIAAYARMEHALTVVGMSRRPSEAPLEFLQRALVSLNASVPSAQRLTDLFARAKFSPHAVDREMQLDAVDALTNIRAEVAAAA